MNKENILTIDFETRSSVDLKLYGRHNYMADPHFKIILMSVKYDNGESKVYTKPSNELIQKIIDEAHMDMLDIVAHNAAFEIACMNKNNVNTYTNGKTSLWRDTMVMCQYYGLPYKLETASEYLKLSNTKLAIGKDLIELFSKPIPERVKIKNKLPMDKIFWEPEDLPEKWAQFEAYCCGDTDATYEMYTTLPAIPDYIWNEWLINVKINNQGILIDRNFCEIATNDLSIEAEEAEEEIRRLTGVDNPNSRTQLKIWFRTFVGIDIDSLNKEVIADLLKDPNIDKTSKKVLELFSIISKTSTKKYTRFQELMSNENKMYDILNFYGARTGRWSSWGVQLHNMKKLDLDTYPNYKELRSQAKAGMLPMFYEGLSDIYSILIRTAIIAPKGYKLIIADFAQIEARVLQWLANDQNTLEIFRSGKDYYTYTASQMFHKKYEDIPKSSIERQKGKTASLALGYGGAVGALDRGSGKSLSLEEKLSLIKLWRMANPKVVKFWDILNSAFTKCFVTKSEVVVPIGIQDKLVFRYSILAGINAISIELPSGRQIWYPGVKYQGKDIVFFGKEDDDQFGETFVKVYGGFLSENIAQAIARDCMQIFVERHVDYGLLPMFHVHDEVITLVPEKDVVEYDLVNKITEMSKKEIYKGLPVIAEPKVSEYYDK